MLKQLKACKYQNLGYLSNLVCMNQNEECLQLRDHMLFSLQKPLVSFSAKDGWCSRNEAAEYCYPHHSVIPALFIAYNAMITELVISSLTFLGRLLPWDLSASQILIIHLHCEVRVLPSAFYTPGNRHKETCLRPNGDSVAEAELELSTSQPLAPSSSPHNLNATGVEHAQLPMTNSSWVLSTSATQALGVSRGHPENEEHVAISQTLHLMS